MLSATIKIVFSTDDPEKAMDILNHIVQSIGWSSEFVEDVYIEEPATPEGE